MKEEDRYVRFKVHGHVPNHNYVTVEFLKDHPLKKSAHIPMPLAILFAMVLISGSILMFYGIYLLVTK